MKTTPIKTVKELIDVLKQYPEDAEVCHLIGDKHTSKTISDGLYIAETHPIGGRDVEDILLLAFSNNLNPFEN